MLRSMTKGMFSRRDATKLPREGGTVSRRTIGYSTCLLAAVFLCLTPGSGVRGEQPSRRLQILFIGDTRALLEPCG